MQAMNNFFWSAAIVLNGDFLKLPKFISMVNGNDNQKNGWHGMYVFSNLPTQGRIYPIDYNFEKFKNHAISASYHWLTQRQWIDYSWAPE
ncbi:MAG: hypothetical protein LBP92_09715 [Deltaproteobacteria bacterium]|jgi:hypothetical protein|nr:hypothetical protein [Deltaproteobacteria bacterium]